MAHDASREDPAVDGGPAGLEPEAVHDDVESPTVLERARALWCQLVSGLG